MSTPKKPRLPVIGPPAAIPVERTAAVAEEYAQRIRRRRRRGWEGTILTGELEPITGKKSSLG